MEHGDLTDRLREMGRTPVDPDLASRHIGMLATTQRTNGRPLARVAVLAMAGLVLLAAPAVALVAATSDDDPDPVVPVEAPDEVVDEDVDDDFTDETDDDTTVDDERDADDADDADEPAAPGAGQGDECGGRPPWAGEPATPADPAEGLVPSQRAEEAHDRNDDRRACRDAEGSEPGGPPASVPGGPPAGEPGGPPTDRPVGPPDDPGNGGGGGPDHTGPGNGGGNGADNGGGADNSAGRGGREGSSPP